MSRESLFSSRASSAGASPRRPARGCQARQTVHTHGDPTGDERRGEGRAYGGWAARGGGREAGRERRQRVLAPPAAYVLLRRLDRLPVLSVGQEGVVARRVPPEHLLGRVGELDPGLALGANERRLARLVRDCARRARQRGRQSNLGRPEERWACSDPRDREAPGRGLGAGTHSSGSWSARTEGHDACRGQPRRHHSLNSRHLLGALALDVSLVWVMTKS